MESLALRRLGVLQLNPLISHCVSRSPALSLLASLLSLSLYIHFNEWLLIYLFNPCSFAVIKSGWVFFWSRIIIRPKTVCSYFQGHYSRRPPSGTEIFFSGSSHLHLTYCSHLVLHLLGPNQHMAAHILLFTVSHSVLSVRSIIHRHNMHICPPFTSPLIVFFFNLYFYFCCCKSWMQRCKDKWLDVLVILLSSVVKPLNFGVAFAI